MCVHDIVCVCVHEITELCSLKHRLNTLNVKISARKVSVIYREKLLCKVKGTATDHSLSSAGLLNYNGSWFLYLSKMDQSRIMTYQSIPETKILWPASCFNLPLSMFVFACLLDSRHLFPAHHNLCQSLGSKLIPSSPFLIPLLNTSCSAYIFLNYLGSYICFLHSIVNPLKSEVL